MEAIQSIEEKGVATAINLFPFSFKAGYEQECSLSYKNDFRPFRLDHLDDENTYYGEFKVSHQNMEAYYLSFTNKILFSSLRASKGLATLFKGPNNWTFNNKPYFNSIQDTLY